VHLSIKIDPKLAALFMTTAKHSCCGFAVALVERQHSGEIARVRV
jgi:hypothetical protein